MRNTWRGWRLILLVVVALLMTGAGPGPASSPVAELLPGQDLGQFYQASTGYAPDPSYFGAYALQPVGDALYLGLGTARPAESDGALLVRLDGAGLHALASLPEQGFIGITAGDGRLYIPGADPEADWSLGNVYIHDLVTGQTIQRRTLPGVIHTLGVWREPDGRLLATVGRYLGEGLNWPWAGGIFASSDEGQTWTLDADPALGSNRTFDVRRWRGGLVAIADDAAIEGCQLATQAPGGSASDAGVWQRGALWVRCAQRLAALGDGRRIVAVGADGRSLVEVTVPRPLPLPFAIERGAWNWQVVVGRTLFVLAEGGRVLATGDLRVWSEVARLATGEGVAGPLVSIAYWPAHEWLIVAERGRAGRLWRIALNES